MIDSPPSSRRRRGISLLEVIACIVLLSVIIIPISGLMRSSARTLESAQGLNDETRSIDALRHMRTTIQNAATFGIIGGRNDRLEITDRLGVPTTWRVQQGTLVEVHQGVETTLLPQVRDLQFSVRPRPTNAAKSDLAFVLERSNASGNRTIRQTHWIEGPL